MPYRVTKRAKLGIQDESLNGKNHVFSRGFVCPAAYQRSLMKQKVCYKYK